MIKYAKKLGLKVIFLIYNELVESCLATKLVEMQEFRIYQSSELVRKRQIQYSFWTPNMQQQAADSGFNIIRYHQSDVDILDILWMSGGYTKSCSRFSSSYLEWYAKSTNLNWLWLCHSIKCFTCQRSINYIYISKIFVTLMLMYLCLDLPSRCLSIRIA